MSGIPIDVMILGLITGIGFGFMIYKVGASNYSCILGMLKLRDFGTLRFMMTGVMVASVIVYLTDSVVWVAPMEWVRLLVGSLIFGVGFAYLGGCPGTVLVQLGEGRKDAIYGILGGLVGSGLYAHVYPTMNKLFIAPYNLGRMTIHSSLGLSNLAGLIILLVVFGATIAIITKMFSGTKPKTVDIDTTKHM